MGNTDERSTREFFEKNGYAVFRGAIPQHEIDHLLGEKIKGDLVDYDGKLERDSGVWEFHKFSRLASGQYYLVNSLSNAHLITKSSELYNFRAAVRRVYFHSAVADCLQILDGETHHICNGGAVFFNSPASEPHIDAWHTNTSPWGHAKTVWIPLEDLGPETGSPFAVPWPLGRLLSAADLGIELPPITPDAAWDEWFPIAYRRYQQALHRLLLSSSAPVASAMLRRGDVMIWSTLTPHGSLPPFGERRTRFSMMANFRPASMNWGRFIFMAGEPPFGPEPRREVRITDAFSLGLNPDQSWEE